jgi:hypothetical protein
MEKANRQMGELAREIPAMPVVWEFFFSHPPS